MIFRASAEPILRGTRLLTIAIVSSVITAAASAQISYFSDFESPDAEVASALSGDFWLVFGNVYGPTGTNWIRGYGSDPAPNSTNQHTPDKFCGLEIGQGGPDQGDQVLVVISDYQNSADHDAGNQIESNVFQEFIIAADDAGEYTFQFDAKRGNLEAPSTALAFIKILNPSTGYSETDIATLDTSDLPVEWGTYSLDITVEAGYAGQLLQFGFANMATSYRASGVYYDNVSFTTQVVVTPPRITSIMNDGGSVTVTFESQDGAYYELLKSPDGLDNFTLVDGETEIPGDGGLVEMYDDFATEPKAFYQVRQQP